MHVPTFDNLLIHDIAENVIIMNSALTQTILYTFSVLMIFFMVLLSLIQFLSVFYVVLF